MKEFSETSGALESQDDVKPGVYRSRLFGFIHRQAYRLREGVGLGFRQVKVSVQWTGQVLLSPLRWFDKFKQDPSRQIAGQERLKQLQPRIEVESLLAEVAAAGYGELQMPVREDWSVVDESDWDTTLLGSSQLALKGESAPPQRTKPVIRGLASLVVDRSLVLVDRYNQILEVLSPSQQFHLQCQIDPVLAQQWSIDRASTAQLPGADSFLLQTAVNSQVVDQPALTPAPPPTTWQKLGYWLHFYREYLWIDSPEINHSDKEAAGQMTIFRTGTTVLPTRKFNQLLSRSKLSVSSAANDLVSAPVAAVKIPVVNSVKQVLGDRSPDWEVEGGRVLVPQAAKNKTVFTPEWIDIPTADLGYHRSIFVRLMEWLDQLMLILENWLAEVFQRLFSKSN